MKTLNRDGIQRMIESGSGSVGGGVSASPESLAGYATQMWVNGNYVSIKFFSKLFQALDENGDPIDPNDMDTVIDSIQSMFGFWTNAYISALGQNDDGGQVLLTLASLADVDVSTVQNGDSLVWNAALRKWVPGSSGIDLTAMWAALATNGNQQIDSSHLSTALSGYATQTWVGQQGYITASALNGYATESWVGTQISDMATQTWVGNNYLSQTDAATTYLSKTDAANTYLSIAFFARLFRAYNGSTAVNPNDTTSTIDNIKAMFGFWTEQYISALGNSGGGSAYVTMDQVWTALGNATNEQINISHLTTALSGYNPTSNFKTINGNSIIGTGDIVVSGGGGTVTIIKVGSISYSPTDGVVSLPAYPTDADTLDGYHAYVGNAPFGKIPVVTDSGFTDVGNSFEMHYDNSGSIDYSTRLYCTGNYQNAVALPSTSGTLALTTDNVASATKLQTPRTIWGQSFDGSANVDGTLTIRNGDFHLFVYDNSGERGIFFREGFVSNDIYNLSILTYDHQNGGDSSPDGISINGYDGVSFCTGSGSRQERMRIAQSGNVGIGTTSPEVKLDVLGRTRTCTTHETSDQSTNYYSGIEIREYNYSQTTSTDVIYAPAITFHWFGRIGTRLYLTHLGELTFTNDFKAARITGSSFVKEGGTSSQFLKADGSVDSTSYLSLSGGTMSNTNVVTNLNADLLDGQHGSYYATASSLSNYLPLTGGTITGSLNIESGSLMINAFSSNETGIFFRKGFVTSNKYNVSILSYDHNGNAADGISINGYDGVSFCTGSNNRQERMRVAENGNVGIGTTSPSYKLQVAGTIGVTGANIEVVNQSSNNGIWVELKGVSEDFGLAIGSGNTDRGIMDFKRSNWMIYFDASNTYCDYGNFVCSGGVTALSDARHKSIVGGTEISVEQIARMRSVKFLWNDGRNDNDVHVGSIAQDWQNILPEVVIRKDDKDGTLSLNYGVAALISVITTARKVVDHERRIKELEKENERLRFEVEQLKIS